MDRSLQSRSSRSKGKPSLGSAATGALVPVLKERAPVEEENYLAVKRLKSAKMVVGSIGSDSTEKNFHPSKVSRKSLKEGIATPMKTLLAEEMSKDKERRQSPGVVAKLMGLEPLPTQHQTHKQKRRLSENYNRKTMFELQENHYAYREHVFPKNKTSQDLEQVKDIHEVLQAPKVEKGMSIPAQKETTRSRLNVEREAYIRQKIMDAKCLSIDKNCHHSKDFHDALEVLESNKDLFLKILQEPDSLFMKHLHDMQSPASSAHIKVLKSSKASMQGKSKICSNREVRTKEMQMEKPAVCPSHKLLNLQHEVKTVSDLPTEIVVLKPNFGRAQALGGVVPMPNFLPSSYVTYRRHRETQRSGKGDSLPEEKSTMKVTQNVEHAKQRQKGSREIAREITHQMRLSAGADSVSNISTMGRKGSSSYERSCTPSNAEFLSDHKAFKKSASSHCQNQGANCTPSLSRLTESYVSKEAKRRLSERWKMTRTSQEASVHKGVNTLGEMLALDNRITRHASSDSMIVQAGSSDRSMGRWPSPLGISSRDGWKDVSSCNLKRSRSLPASSTLNENLNMSGGCEAQSDDKYSVMREMVHERDENLAEQNWLDDRAYSTSRSIEIDSRNGECIFLGDTEYDNPIQKSDLLQNELKDKHKVRNPSEEEPFCPESYLHRARNSECELNNLPDVKEVACNQNDPIIEDNLFNQCPMESHLDTRDSASHLSSNVAEQPSPVSVLEPISDEDVSSSDCFEKVSADLHGLRLQLKLLKMESAEVSSELSCPTVSSDDEAEEECDFLAEVNESDVISEKNRDFSFVLDALVTSGLDASLHEVLFATRYSSEFPMNPDVFKKLDRKYKGWQTWTRGERRLLFDRMNCILAEILGTCMDERPWVKAKACRKGQLGWSTETLVEKIWKLLSSQGSDGRQDWTGKALRRNILWTDFSDDVDKIGQELQGFLMEELMEEIVMDLLILH